MRHAYFAYATLQAMKRPPQYIPDLEGIAIARMDKGIVVDTDTEAYRQMLIKYRGSADACANCGGNHAVERCPISLDTSPEMERAKAKRGGCCGSPTKA